MHRITAHRPITSRAFGRIAAVVATAAAGALLAAPAPATAGGSDDRVERSGSCSGGARWDLKVKTDDGRLEVEGEVDSNRNGQSWHWKIRHDGETTARGTARTAGRSGSFSVERRVVDLAGSDKIVFLASHDGQTCRGVINF